VTNAGQPEALRQPGKGDTDRGGTGRSPRSVAAVHADDVMQDGSSEVEARIRIAALQYKLEAFERAKQRMPEHPPPAGVVTRHIEDWERQTHDFRMAARAAAPEQQLPESFLRTDQARGKLARGFVSDQFFRFLDIARDPNGHRMRNRAVAFEQFDQRHVAVLVSPGDRRLADVRFRVRVRAALEQSFRDSEPAPVGALIERTSPAISIGAFDGSAFVGIEPGCHRCVWRGATRFRLMASSSLRSNAFIS
jgi:hypothetical protein